MPGGCGEVRRHPRRDRQHAARRHAERRPPGVRMWAKLEGKNPTGPPRTASPRMVEAAERPPASSPRTTILEPTSGNTGIALAMVARRKGYRLTVVIPDNASEERHRAARAVRRRDRVQPGDEGHERLDRGRARARRRTTSTTCRSSTGTPRTRWRTRRAPAPEISRDLPEITHFVAGMGTGGTLTGTGRRLHAHNPDDQGDRRRARARRPGLRAALARRRVRPADLRPGAGRPEVPGELGRLAARERAS